MTAIQYGPCCEMNFEEFTPISGSYLFHTDLPIRHVDIENKNGGSWALGCRLIGKMSLLAENCAIRSTFGVSVFSMNSPKPEHTPTGLRLGESD